MPESVVSVARDRRPEWLVIDLSRLSFIDSGGVHGLMEAHKRCVAQGTRLVIIPGPNAAQRIVEICGLLGAVPFGAQDGSEHGRDGHEDQHLRT